MGLFSRKKKVEVPVPPHEDLLRFPKPSQVERVIQPEKVKEAAGIGKPLPPPEEPLPVVSPPLEKPVRERQEPFFIRIQHYRELIKDLDYVKEKSEKMEKINEELEKSEFNEKKDYESLKNNLKKIHERLLFMDDTIFKNR
jgi:hypothetical protein